MILYTARIENCHFLGFLGKKEQESEGRFLRVGKEVKGPCVTGVKGPCDGKEGRCKSWLEGLAKFPKQS